MMMIMMIMMMVMMMMMMMIIIIIIILWAFFGKYFPSYAAIDFLPHRNRQYNLQKHKLVSVRFVTRPGEYMAQRGTR